MFPQVAPKFFSTRAEGPKNLSKLPKKDAAQAAGKSAVPAAPAKSNLTGPVSYIVTYGGKSHNVTVAPGE